jgi:antitoxin ParD1/3/4
MVPGLDRIDCSIPVPPYEAKPVNAPPYFAAGGERRRNGRKPAPLVLVPDYGIRGRPANGGEMPKNTSVIIGDHFADFIERQVEEGRYGSASDVVRAGLRLLEEREVRIEALRAALIEGEQSGSSTPFDFDTFVNRKRSKRKRAEKSAT